MGLVSRLVVTGNNYRWWFKFQDLEDHMNNERNMYCSIEVTNNRANYLPIAQTQSVSTFQPFFKYIRFAISLLTRRYSKVLQFLYKHTSSYIVPIAQTIR